MVYLVIYHVRDTGNHWMAWAQIKDFISIADEHGLSRAWLYRQLAKFSLCYKKGMRSAPGAPTFALIVQDDELLNLILANSRKSSVVPLLTLAWSIPFARRMTHLVLQSKGQWSRHYSTPRDKGRIIVSIPEDLFALNPRYSFYIDYLDEIEKVLPNDFIVKLRRFFEKTYKDAVDYVNMLLTDKVIAYQIMNVNYEEFFSLILDELTYGAGKEDAFKKALQSAPKHFDTTSSKEVAAEGMEWFSDGEYFENSASFDMDFQKLMRQFKETLLERQMAKLSRKTRVPTPEQVATAKTKAEEEFKIMELYFHGASDAEIIEKLDLGIARQTLAEKRTRINQLAQEIFAPLKA